MSFNGGVPQTCGDWEGQRCGYVVVFAVGQRNEDTDVALRDDINIHECHTFLDKAIIPRYVIKYKICTSWNGEER